MRRLVFTVLFLAVLAAGALSTMGARDENAAPRYFVELDNAFGLVDGADVKVAGVRAGKIEGFTVDPESYDAVVEISIGKQGFGDLRTDVFCETRPQSLIGEYFLDCHPGKSPVKLEPGSRVPVEQTGSTIPPDLINNVMRRPYRERFSIIIGELGAALTARGEELNETIRRANPALRETNKVIAQLREQRAVIRELTSDAETVVTALADKSHDVKRFIDEARDTSQASSERYAGLREQFQRFPGFLRELRPTMKLLGEAADRQRPALVNLSDNAELLERFLDELAPFSDASRPAFRTLASLAREGRDTVEVSLPRIRELRTFTALLPEVVRNLAITLEHLDNRDFAVEPDPRSPGGKGYTGLEAFLTYVFSQSQATNVFDANAYFLKVSGLLDNNCAQYADVAAALDKKKQYCRATLGRNQPGIDDKAPPQDPRGERRAKRRPEAPVTQPGDDREQPEEPKRDRKLPDKLQELLDDVLRGVPIDPQDVPAVPRDQMPLLDFLLGQ